jgi:hypothetical protein
MSKIISKQLNFMEDWGCDSVVEHLPSMHKVMGSIPSTGKKFVSDQNQQKLGTAGHVESMCLTLQKTGACFLR